VSFALWLLLLAQPDPACVRRPLEQGAGTVLVCKAGAL
jgi:hypothetical protein